MMNQTLSQEKPATKPRLLKINTKSQQNEANVFRVFQTAFRCAPLGGYVDISQFVMADLADTSLSTFIRKMNILISDGWLEKKNRGVKRTCLYKATPKMLELMADAQFSLPIQKMTYTSKVLYKKSKSTRHAHTENLEFPAAYTKTIAQNDPPGLKSLTVANWTLINGLDRAMQIAGLPSATRAGMTLAYFQNQQEAGANRMAEFYGNQHCGFG